MYQIFETLNNPFNQNCLFPRLLHFLTFQWSYHLVVLQFQQHILCCGEIFGFIFKINITISYLKTLTKTSSCVWNGQKSVIGQYQTTGKL